MPKHPRPSGPPQYLHVRASYELPGHHVRGQRASIAGAFCGGVLKGTLIALLPVLLVVGALDYLANGWSDFGWELIHHWILIAAPLAFCGLCGGIAAVVRR